MKLEGQERNHGSAAFRLEKKIFLFSAKGFVDFKIKPMFASAFREKQTGV